MNTEPKQRGGARPGSGPKPKPADQQSRYKSVFLDEETISLGTKIGDGKISAGIRKAIRYYAEHAENP